MQVVFNSYSKAVNKQQKRKGTLFERRFKAKLIDNDAYSIHLMRYIHKNPVEAKLTKTPESWTWSNYRDHQGLRTGTLLHWPSFKQYFKSPMNYKNFVENETIPKPDKFDQVCFD